MGRFKDGFGSKQLGDWCCHLLKGNVLGVERFVLFRRKIMKPLLDPLTYRYPVKYSSEILNRQLNT